MIVTVIFKPGYCPRTHGTVPAVLATSLWSVRNESAGRYSLQDLKKKKQVDVEWTRYDQERGLFGHVVCFVYY